MKNKKNSVAVICAWRKGETDLAATLESAEKSAGPGARLYAVEDKDGTGPGYNRNRAIEAANDAEIVIIIDAHMRFQGDVLQKMAKIVRKKGGLITPFCHHNDKCEFTKHFYAGARMVYRAKDGTHRTSLPAKWARETTPGPRGAVMGACYAFRRDWYFEVGQPLAMLRGWGCDEEALSIAAWLSGHTPEVMDGHVAHLWRGTPPWPVQSIDGANVAANRIALINTCVTDANARRDLLGWMGAGPVTPRPEEERFRQALLKQPRKWVQWRDQVCEPEEIDGKQAYSASIAVDRPVARKTPTQSIRVPVSGVRCPHCGEVSENPPVTNTYGNGNRRRECPTCKNHFISFFHSMN